ncbi:MAG: hypothetical protein HY722_15360 [Planctomycetes bacterium]|nr:hypothetical protein [Planctomycetota bacterium]
MVPIEALRSLERALARIEALAAEGRLVAGDLEAFRAWAAPLRRQLLGARAMSDKELAGWLRSRSEHGECPAALAASLHEAVVATGAAGSEPEPEPVDAPGSDLVPLVVAVTPVVPPGRALPSPVASSSRWTGALQSQASLRWGQMAGALLIVGSSLALATTLWQAEAPWARYGALLAVGAGFLLFGSLAAGPWNLGLLGRSLLVIYALLVPVDGLIAARLEGGPLVVGVLAALLAAGAAWAALHLLTARRAPWVLGLVLLSAVAPVATLAPSQPAILVTGAAAVLLAGVLAAPVADGGAAAGTLAFAFLVGALYVCVGAGAPAPHAGLHPPDLSPATLLVALATLAAARGLAAAGTPGTRAAAAVARALAGLAGLAALGLAAVDPVQRPWPGLAVGAALSVFHALGLVVATGALGALLGASMVVASSSLACVAALSLAPSGVAHEIEATAWVLLGLVWILLASRLRRVAVPETAVLPLAWAGVLACLGAGPVLRGPDGALALGAVAVALGALALDERALGLAAGAGLWVWALRAAPDGEGARAVAGAALSLGLALVALGARRLAVHAAPLRVLGAPVALAAALAAVSSTAWLFPGAMPPGLAAHRALALEAAALLVSAWVLGSPLPSWPAALALAGTTACWVLHREGPEVVREAVYRGLGALMVAGLFLVKCGGPAARLAGTPLAAVAAALSLPAGLAMLLDGPTPGSGVAVAVVQDLGIPAVMLAFTAASFRLPWLMAIALASGAASAGALAWHLGARTPLGGEATALLALAALALILRGAALHRASGRWRWPLACVSALAALACGVGLSLRLVEAHVAMTVPARALAGLAAWSLGLVAVLPVPGSKGAGPRQALSGLFVLGATAWLTTLLAGGTHGGRLALGWALGGAATTLAAAAWPRGEALRDGRTLGLGLAAAATVAWALAPLEAPAVLALALAGAAVVALGVLASMGALVRTGGLALAVAAHLALHRALPLGERPDHAASFALLAVVYAFAWSAVGMALERLRAGPPARAYADVGVAVSLAAPAWLALHVAALDGGEAAPAAVAQGLSAAAGLAGFHLWAAHRYRLEVYVYVGEAAVVGTLAYLRLAAPSLFHLGFVRRFWPLIVVGVAYLAGAVAVALERARAALYARPTAWVALLLPAVPALGCWGLGPGNASATFAAMAGLYAALGWAQGRGALRLVAVGAALVALHAGLAHRGWQVLVHPHVYLAPVGLLLAWVAHRERGRLEPRVAETLGGAGLAMAFASMAGALYLDEAHRDLETVLLALASVGGLLAGLALGLRWLTWQGAGFLAFDVLSRVYWAGQEHTWVWWLTGLTLGTSLVAWFGWLERRARTAHGS